MFYRYMRYRNFVHDLAIFIHDMSADGLLRRLRLASELNLLPDAEDTDCAVVSLLTFITSSTLSVQKVWDVIFHTELQAQRQAGDTPPTRTTDDWCRLYIATFYKAKLLRNIPHKLQDAFEAFMRSLESVFMIDGDAKPATSTAQQQQKKQDDRAASTPPPHPSSASGTHDPPHHPFLVLRDRFSATGLGEPSVTSYVSAQMDGRKQVCSVHTPPLPFNLVLRCYRADGVRGVPYRARWKHAYARFNVHVDGRSDVHEALNAFLLSVTNDVLGRGGTHKEHASR